MQMRLHGIVIWGPRHPTTRICQESPASPVSQQEKTMCRSIPDDFQEQDQESRCYMDAPTLTSKVHKNGVCLCLLLMLDCVWIGRTSLTSPFRQLSSLKLFQVVSKRPKPRRDVAELRSSRLALEGSLRGFWMVYQWDICKICLSLAMDLRFRKQQPCVHKLMRCWKAGRWQSKSQTEKRCRSLLCGFAVRS